MDWNRFVHLVISGNVTRRDSWQDASIRLPVYVFLIFLIALIAFSKVQRLPENNFRKLLSFMSFMRFANTCTIPIIHSYSENNAIKLFQLIMEIFFKKDLLRVFCLNICLNEPAVKKIAEIGPSRLPLHKVWLKNLQHPHHDVLRHFAFNYWLSDPYTIKLKQDLKPTYQNQRRTGQFFAKIHMKKLLLLIDGALDKRLQIVMASIWRNIHKSLLFSTSWSYTMSKYKLII